MRNKAKKKLIGFILPPITFILVTAVIVISVVSIVAAPIKAVSQFFSDIGDFFFPDSEPIVLLEEYFKTEQGIEEIVFYQSVVNKTDDLAVPINWLIIPNYLVGLEANEDDIIQQISAAKKCTTNEETKEVSCELETLEDYIDKIKRISVYKKGFEGISTSTIASYINHFSTLSASSSIDDAFLEGLKDGDFLYPFKRQAMVTSTLGWRTYYYKGQWITDYHDAIDLAFAYPDNCGEPIYAVQDGVVISNNHGKDPGWGNFGKVAYKEDLVIEYWHMSSTFPYAVGEFIKKGDLIGYVGNTGQSTACHLHLAFKYKGEIVDPEDYLKFR